MSFYKTSLVLLGMTFLSTPFSSQAFAGFDAPYKNGAAAPSTDYNVAKGIDDKAPALKVFEEQYIPDSVRQKYGLSGDWGNGAQGPATGAPVDMSASGPAPLTPMPGDPMASMPAPTSEPAELMIVPKATPAKDMVWSWRARKGENVRDVLRRWSERENVDLMWASTSAPALKKEFSYVGKFQDAVNLMLKESGVAGLHSQFRSEGMAPVMMEPASTVTTNLPVPEAPATAQAAGKTPAATSVASIFKPDEKKGEGPETRWFGLSGAPLAEVLQVWAEDAGVTLVWQSEKNYALKESVSQVGSFEEAVYKALNQYNGEQVRPVGEMYKDEDGKKVLVIRTDAS